MSILRVNQVLREKILVSRESARLLEDGLGALLRASKSCDISSPPSDVVLDFQGVEGIAPSFLDELISIFESQTGAIAGTEQRCIVVAHPPARLSLKFEAIARSHDMTIQAQPDGSWRLNNTSGESPGPGELQTG